MTEASGAIASPRLRTVAVAPLLAFVAGFVDTVGFLALFGLFTAHVTGNFVVLGASLVESGHGLVAKLLALPVFILVVAAAHRFERRCADKARRADRAMLTAQALLLGGFLYAGLQAVASQDADGPIAVLAGMLGVSAMAVQNAASRSVFSALSPTTVMTGNVTQLTIDLVDLASGAPSARRNELKARVGRMWPPVVAFAAGAGAAGFSYSAYGFYCLVVAIAALAAVAALVEGGRA